MRVWDGVKESSKKKLVHGLVMWTKQKMTNWQREQVPRKWKENGGDEERNCDGDSLKSDLERVGEEWGKIYTDR